MNFTRILHNMVCIAIGCRLTVFKWDSTANSKLNHRSSEHVNNHAKPAYINDFVKVSILKLHRHSYFK